MFSALAPRYRLFNRCSSVGLDGRWRKDVVSELVGVRRVLDVGSGTGDLAWEFLSRRTTSPSVVGIDLSFEMLAQAERVGNAMAPLWVQGSGAQLPFRDGSFDAVVSAYVLRNLWVGGVLSHTLRETARVLKEDGRLVFLDLTRPHYRLLRAGHFIYNHTVLPVVGKLLFGRRWPGAYLADSIQNLPGPTAMETVFHENGFRSFECRPLWGGIVSLFIGKK